MCIFMVFFFFSSRRRHTRLQGDWSSDVCSSDLELVTQRGVGESASAVWKAVQEQHARLLPASSVLDEELGEELVASPFDEVVRSEERRVGKECRARWSQQDEKEKKKNG